MKQSLIIVVERLFVCHVRTLVMECLGKTIDSNKVLLAISNGPQITFNHLRF